MSSSAPSESASETKTILLVDDEPMLVELTAFSLTDSGFKVLSAGSAEEALKIAAGALVSIDLVITDSEMPGISGRELIVRLRSERPEIKAIISSGYTQDHITAESVPDPSIGFLSKPFDRKKLLDAVEHAIGS